AAALDPSTRSGEDPSARSGHDPSTRSGHDPSTRSGYAGALFLCRGLVRNHTLGRSVRYLEYEAYQPLALKAFERIASEIAERWPSARLALHHRIGRPEARGARL